MQNEGKEFDSFIHKLRDLKNREKIEIDNSFKARLKESVLEEAVKMKQDSPWFVVRIWWKKHIFLAPLLTLFLVVTAVFGQDAVFWAGKGVQEMATKIGYSMFDLNKEIVPEMLDMKSLPAKEVEIKTEKNVLKNLIEDVREEAEEEKEKELLEENVKDLKTEEDALEKEDLLSGGLEGMGGGPLLVEPKVDLVVPSSSSLKMIPVSNEVKTVPVSPGGPVVSVPLSTTPLTSEVATMQKVEVIYNDVFLAEQKQELYKCCLNAYLDSKLYIKVILEWQEKGKIVKAIIFKKDGSVILKEWEI